MSVRTWFAQHPKIASLLRVDTANVGRTNKMRHVFVHPTMLASVPQNTDLSSLGSETIRIGKKSQPLPSFANWADYATFIAETINIPQLLEMVSEEKIRPLFIDGTPEQLSPADQQEIASFMKAGELSKADYKHELFYCAREGLWAAAPVGFFRRHAFIPAITLTPSNQTVYCFASVDHCWNGVETKTVGQNAIGISVIGKRPSHQDRLTIQEENNRVVLVVADGIGGNPNGNLAAALGTQTAARQMLDISIVKKETIEQAFTVASSAIAEEGDRLSTPSMGTTLVAAIIQGEETFIASVGDSRAYILLANGESYRLSSDDTLSDDPSILSSNLGRGFTGSVNIRKTPLRVGERLLLCSDGLTKAAQAAGTSVFQLLKETREMELDAAANYILEQLNPYITDNTTFILYGRKENK